MYELILGVASLLALVALRAGMDRWSLHRAARAWEAAQAHIAAGDYTDAERSLSTCVRLAPLWLPGRYAYGAVLTSLGKLEAAEAQLKAGPALEPRDPVGYTELGIFYITAANRTEEGLAKLREAIALDANTLMKLENDPRLTDFRTTSAFESLRTDA